MPEAKDFWEKKILHWEQARYSPLRSLSPLSWTVRGRLNAAVRVTKERLPKGGRILELGCGSGLFATKLLSHVSSYRGFDIASNAVIEATRRLSHADYLFFCGDVLEVEWPVADLTVFLGLTDWLNPNDVQKLFGKVRSPDILFSFTEAGKLNPYRLYRLWMDTPDSNSPCQAKMYSTQFMRNMLTQHGYAMELLIAPSLTNPGGLVWAKKTR